MVSEITSFYCQPDMRSSSVRCQEALHAFFHEGFWKSDHDFLIVFHTNFLFGMQVFEIPGFIASRIWRHRPSSANRTLHANYHDGFWKSDHYFLIAFHCNFLCGMHGFQDEVVIFEAACDVIMISLPGGVARNFLIADSERATLILF